MPAEFLPLEVGKRWNYDLTDESGQRAGQMAFAVEEYTIVSGTSFYALSGFPFSNESQDIRLVRYDRTERLFMRKLGNDEGPLFYGADATTEVIESDAAGTPTKFILRLEATTLTFERGVGIIEARLRRPTGTLIAKILRTPAPSTTAAPATSGPAAGPTAATPSPRASTGTNPTGTVVVPRGAPMVVIPPVAAPPARRESVVATLSSENPQFDVGVSPSPDGYDIVLAVTNTSEKLLPFRFSSSQTFDIVVTDSAGKEVWRWSKGHFFTQVVRSDSIRSKGRWLFQEVWNRRDNEGNGVVPGQYKVTAMITSLPAIQAVPVILEIR